MGTKKIILCSNGPGRMQEVADCLNGTQAFDIIICEEGADVAVAKAEEIQAALLIINLSDLEDNTHISIMRLQTAGKTQLLVYGETMEYTAFLGKYMGNDINQLEKPLDKESLLQTVGRALHMSLAAHPKVLIIDDNALILRGLKSMLNTVYEVTIATSGAAGLEQMKSNRPDMVLLDYEMPEMNGQEVLQRIRDDEELKEMHVIFLTGINDVEHIKAVMPLEPDGYLLKPIEKKNLIAAIDAALYG